MRRYLKRLMPRIWTRLFLLTILAIVLTWSVIGLALRALDEANDVVTELDTVHVPALTQTSQFSTQIAELAIRSNELLLATSIADSRIPSVMEELNQFLTHQLDDPELKVETRRIVEELETVSETLARMNRLEADIRDEVAQLRWLNLELQEETSALVADFTFNIKAQIRALVAEEEAENRQNKAEFLVDEARRRDMFTSLASELMQLGSVALQVANGTSRQQLDQLIDILSDAFVEVNTVLVQVPDGSEFLTLRQSVVAYEDMTMGRGGLVALRSEWAELHGRVQYELESALSGLAGIQQNLQIEAAAQRRSFFATTRAFSADTERKRVMLLMLTIVALAGGLGILFLYIRPVIIRPMRDLTDAMTHIAQGQEVDVSDVGKRNDEIGQLSNAVQMFRSSVRARDKAIAQLKETQNELVQAGKMAALGNLSAGIGHELNQPLGAMKQRFHLLHSAIQSGDVDAQKRQIDKIEALALRMEQIIAHLKKFARRSEHLKEDVYLKPLVRSAGDLMKASLTERKVVLILDPKLENVEFRGDPVLVEQVVVNLLSNASDAIAETGQSGEIHVDVAEAKHGKIAFSVADTGVGLGDLEPERLIEPFVTTKNPGAGLGLGLSISYNILIGLGGDLTIERRRGAGVRVTVTLPAAEQTA